MSKDRIDHGAERVPSRIDSKLVQLTICIVFLPSVTGALAAESKSAEDPDLLLQRIRSRITAHQSQLHNYTCHVVIDRLVRAISSNSFHRQDRAEVDVAFVGDRELFARPGEVRFEEQSINKIVPLGMIGNDMLGSHDDTVLSGDVATFKYIGSCKKDGFKTLRYDFSVPQANSRLLVAQANAGDAVVGYHGSFWVNAETLDMVRLDWKTDHIPKAVGISSVEKSLRYKVVRIGNSDFLLALHSELTSFDQAGNHRINMISLDRCLEFSGQSVVTYGSPLGGVPAQPLGTDRPKQ